MKRNRLLGNFAILTVISVLSFGCSSDDDSNSTPSEPTIPTNGLIAWYPFNGNVNDFYLGYLESFSKSQLKMVNKSLKNKRNTKSEIDYYKNQKKIFIYLCDWFEKNPNPSVIVI